MELLAPAGDPRALSAALQYGADAVYLGYTAFGARGYAGNFDEEALREAVRLAHTWGKRVYVTVNTLVFSKEYGALESLLAFLSEIAMDAIIVQDPGVARFARLAFPDLTLHASTQMGLHNRQGARLARSLGFARVVPARECALAELSEMAAEGIEIEAFVHGALCVSMSGQCLFSSMLGGRSGNRGRCAQPCRLPYQLEGDQGHWLSPRDLCLLGELPALQAAGVSALKIEGRMKRPEYVAVVTALYRKHLDALHRGAPLPVSQEDISELRQVFHRGGFTRGYAMGESQGDILFPERPNHGGIPVGQVERVTGRFADVRLSEALNPGDYLQIRGRQDQEATYTGEAAPAESIVRLSLPTNARPGDPVVRLTDATQMERLAPLRQEHPVALSLALTLRPGEVPVLRADDGTRQVDIRGEVPVQAARTRRLTHEEALAQLDRLGDTPYRIESLSYEDEGGFLPVSALNALRREAIQALTARRIHRKAARRSGARLSDFPAPPPPQLIAQSAILADVDLCGTAGADAFYWQPEDYRLGSLGKALTEYVGSLPVALVLPPFLTGSCLKALYDFLQGAGAKLSGLVLTNPGQFVDMPPFPYYGDAGLHTFSAWGAATWFGLGASRLTLSPELNIKQMEEVLTHGGAYEVLAYGRAQMMILSHCARRVRAGERGNDETCDWCAHAALPPLIDRKGMSLPQSRIRQEDGCKIRLWNPVPTYVGRDYRTLAPYRVSLRAVFTDETDDRKKEILKTLRALMDGETPDDLGFPTTHGHFGRGVE